MVRTFSLTRVALFTVALGLAACGGGGGGGGSSLSGGGSGGGSGYAGDPKIQFFNVTPTTIEQGDTFTVSWTVDPDTLYAGTYHAEFHLSTEPAIPSTDSPLGPVSLGALTRVFEVNGSVNDMPYMQGTDVDLVLNRQDYFGMDAVIPGFLQSYIPFSLDQHLPSGTTTLYAILEVCAVQSDLKTHCTVTEGDAAVKLTFPPAQ